jgi:hypothetical protein
VRVAHVVKIFSQLLVLALQVPQQLERALHTLQRGRRSGVSAVRSPHAVAAAIACLALTSDSTSLASSSTVLEASLCAPISLLTEQDQCALLGLQVISVDRHDMCESLCWIIFHDKAG